MTHEELIAYYAAADVFLCLSNHEGFCVPLFESMYHRLPIVAYPNTAVPETVQGRPDPAGQGPARVAAAIDRVVDDPTAVGVGRGGRRTGGLLRPPGSGTFRGRARRGLRRPGGQLRLAPPARMIPAPSAGPRQRRTVAVLCLPRCR